MPSALSTNRILHRYELDETGFDGFPRKWRRFYRHWAGGGDVLAPNEVLCPVCNVVIRSHQELRSGDNVYCMPCMSRMVLVTAADGSLGTKVIF